MLQPDVNKGLRNDFKAAMERVDRQYLDELIQQQEGESSGSTDIQVKDDGTTLDDIKSMAEGMGKGDTQHDQQVILKYLEFLMQCWAMDLNDKPQEVKRQLEGKIASATHSQTQGYLKPLFRKLKYKKTPKDILESLVDIVSSMLAGEYVKANDAYLQMAIGNAPWPIGVTMVGIHARTGREKIFSQHVAHVLNDETQRKYIQGLKRLMTYCQKRFPADPSKSVEYKALA